MDVTNIPLSAIPHTSRLFRDYAAGAPSAAGIFPYSYRDERSFASAAGRIPYPEALRRAVVEILTDQNRCWVASEARERNLARLARPGCLAVVTGQQVGLFTGPAFAIYKALTAVKLAEHLTAQGIETVPIFWLATEDHDLAEVNHTWVMDRDGKPHKISYAGQPGVADSPAGALALGADIAGSIDALRQALPESGAEEILEWLSAAYKPGATLGGAFGAAMARLLAPYGVLTIDPLDQRAHRLCTKVFQHAVDDAAGARQALLRRNEHLVSAGYHAQVRVTDESTLLFAYEDGRRAVLHGRGDGFVSAANKQYAPADLRRLAEVNPELLSPTALLRPVMQDALLPTVSYVGGPAEIAYLAQAAPLYERILGRMPVVVPRASLTLLDGPVQRVTHKYGLSLDDIFAGRQPLREKMAARFFSPDLTAQFTSATESLERHMAAIQEALGKLDPTLVDAARHGAQKMHYQITSLERKAAAAVQSKSDQVERDASRIENAVYPEKTMQERVYSGASLLARHGMQLVDELYRVIPPLPVDHQIVAG